jgi:hypothetical protein
MKKVLVLFQVLLVSFVTTYAQPSGKSLLWKISGNGLIESSYIFGTFHLLCPDQDIIDTRIENALMESKILALELDFDDPEMMGTITMGMFFQDGTKASDYLNEEEYKLVADFFIEKMKMPFEQLASIKPFFLSAMTMIYFLDCQPVSVEMKLAEIAADHDIEVTGLETVEEQLQFINDISLEDQKAMLIEGVEDLEEMNGMTSKMVEIYMKEDLDGIQTIMDEYMEDEYVELNDNLILSRNENWIPKIEKLMAEQASFIAIGAGHLSGEHGLLKKLWEAGYTVEAVK